MNIADIFRQMQIRQETTPSPIYTQENSFGYPTIMVGQAEQQAGGPGLMNYFKQNPHVAGMAWGAGSNGSDPSVPRSVVVNPFNKNMIFPEKRRGLQMIEAVRHKMDETNYQPNFPVSPEMQAYREATYGANEPYRTDDTAFRNSMISRAMVGDLPKDPRYPMPAVENAARQFEQKYFPSQP